MDIESQLQSRDCDRTISACCYLLLVLVLCALMALAWASDLPSTVLMTILVAILWVSFVGLINCVLDEDG